MLKNSIELRLNFPKVLSTRKVSLAVCQFHPWQAPELSCAAWMQNSALQWRVKPSNHGYSMNTYFWISLKASVLVHLSLPHKSSDYCTTLNYEHKHISHISKLNWLDLHEVLQLKLKYFIPLIKLAQFCVDMAIFFKGEYFGNEIVPCQLNMKETGGLFLSLSKENGQ